MASTQIPQPNLELGAGAGHFRGESDGGVSGGGDAISSSSCSQFQPSARVAGSRDGGECCRSVLQPVEVESKDGEVKVNFGLPERDCRICHLGLGGNGERATDLGCSCKGELAAAHKRCAEDWFRIRGNRTCEICHSIARNIAAPNEPEPTAPPTEANNVMSISVVSTLASPDHRNFWHGHRFLNFLLACMVVAFVVSWLFHFRVPSRH